MFRPALHLAHWIAGTSSLLLLVLMLVAMPSSATKQTVRQVTPDACGARIAKGLGYWNCTFIDHFSGTTINSAKWNLQDTSLSGFYLGRTCFKAGKYARVAKGMLRLSVNKLSTPFTCKSPNGKSFQTRYLGSDVNTWGKFSQTTGRFEARMRFPAYTAAGYHGGFWMNPQDQSYGSWPLSGEIDVAEWWSSTPERAYPSLHFLGSTTNDTGRNCIIGKANEFHTYAVEWTLARIKFIYDGKTCFQRWLTPTLLLPVLPFDKRFFISLTFGEGYPVGTSTTRTPWPATMLVDYVKVWS